MKRSSCGRGGPCSIQPGGGRRGTLRRSGKFSQLTPEEQRTILAEHGALGMTFGAADFAHDVRLACHGLDRDDNDFVIGLIGKELFPLSAWSRLCARPSRPRSTSIDWARSLSAARSGSRKCPPDYAILQVMTKGFRGTWLRGTKIRSRPPSGRSNAP